MKPILLLLFFLFTFYACTWKSENDKTITLNKIKEIEHDHYKSLTKSLSFSKYCTQKQYLGNKGKLILSQLNHLPKEIIKIIENQYNKANKPNFANQYMIISWSCGSPCQMHVIFDFNTGKPILFTNSSIGINFKPDSYLLIKNPPTNEIYDEDFRNVIGKPTFYIFKNDSLKEVN